jgi:hypothetical protein
MMLAEKPAAMVEHGSGEALVRAYNRTSRMAGMGESLPRRQEDDREDHKTCHDPSRQREQLQPHVSPRHTADRFNQLFDLLPLIDHVAGGEGAGHAMRYVIT